MATPFAHPKGPRKVCTSANLERAGLHVAGDLREPKGAVEPDWLVLPERGAQRGLGIALAAAAPAILLRIAFIAATVLGAAGIWVYLASVVLHPARAPGPIATVRV